VPDMSGFASSAQLLMGTTDGGSESYGVNAMLNVPLATDRAALRVVAGLQEYGGWIDRIVIAEPSFPLPVPGETRGDVVNAPVAKVHRDDNTTRIETVRASLAFDATDNLTITPRVMYSRTEQETADAYDSPPGSSRSSQQRKVYQAFDTKSSFTDTLKLAGLTIDAQLGDINITAISGAWNRETFRQAANNEGLTILYGMPSVYTTDGLGVGELAPTNEGDGSQFSQEVRVSSTGSGNFSWVVGGYYADYDYDDVALLSSPGFTSFTAYGPGFFPSEVFFDFRTKNVIEQSAVFANITYALPYNFELRAGARYYRYDTEFDVTSFGSAVGTEEPVTSSADSSEDGVSPSVTLSYLPTEDFTAYATVSEGFRPGGGNFPIVQSGPAGEACQAGLDALGLDGAPATYDSDSVTNYELGEKWRLFDRRVTLNAAVFLLKWDGVQQPVILGGACGSNFVVNGPDAEVKGGEAELSVALLPELTLSATASYNDAKFVESDLATGIEEGDLLAGVPEWTTTVALEYRRPIATGDVFVRASHREMDSRPRPDGSETPLLPQQSMTDLRLGWIGGRYSVNLSVDNVFDHVMDNGDRGTICCGIPNGYRFISTNRPRSFSVDLTAQF
jgi:iron complex outermembrane receptor protein